MEWNVQTYMLIVYVHEIDILKIELVKSNLNMPDVYNQIAVLCDTNMFKNIPSLPQDSRWNVGANYGWFRHGGTWDYLARIFLDSTCTHRIHGTGVFTYIWLIFMGNIGKYTIHVSYGVWSLPCWKNSCWKSMMKYVNWSYLCVGILRIYPVI